MTKSRLVFPQPKLLEPISEADETYRKDSNQRAGLHLLSNLAGNVGQMLANLNLSTQESRGKHNETTMERARELSVGAGSFNDTDLIVCAEETYELVKQSAHIEGAGDAIPAPLQEAASNYKRELDERGLKIAVSRTPPVVPSQSAADALVALRDDVLARLPSTLTPRVPSPAGAKQKSKHKASTISLVFSAEKAVAGQRSESGWSFDEICFNAYEQLRDRTHLETYEQHPCALPQLGPLIERLRDPKLSEPAEKIKAANALLAPLRAEESVMQTLCMVAAYADLPTTLGTPLQLEFQVSGRMFGGSCEKRALRYDVADTLWEGDCKGLFLCATDPTEANLIVFQGTCPEDLHGLVADINRAGVGKIAFDNSWAGEKLRTWASKDSDGPLRVMGHSLGAALAQRLFAAISPERRASTTLWTFSPPGVEPEALEALEGVDITGQVCHFWHEADIVKTAGHLHVPGIVVEYVADIPNILASHVMPCLSLAERGQQPGDLQWRVRDLRVKPLVYQKHFNVSEIIRSYTGQGYELLEKVVGNFLKRFDGPAESKR